MRDHPELAAGSSRGEAVWKRHVSEQERHRVLEAGCLRPEQADAIALAPKVRIRVEHFGAEIYQPLFDQRIKLSTKQLDVVRLLDGMKSRDDLIGAALATGIDFDTATSTVVMLEASHAIVSSRARVPQVIKIERWGSNEVVDRLSSPVNVLWEPTLRCNLQCDFCYNESGPSGDNGEKRDQAAAEIIKSGALQVTIIGGEPMLLPDFVEQIKRFEMFGVGVDFVTNGWFLDEATIETLMETDVSQLMLSIDGLELTHDKIRGRKGSYVRAIRGLQMLSAAGFDVTVAPCLQRSNITELEALIDELAAAGARRIKLRPMIAEGRGLSVFGEKGLTLGEIERYQPSIAKKAAEYKGKVSIVHRMPACQRGVCACDYNPSYPGVISRHKGTCGIGRNMCYVRVDGGVTPNSNLREALIDNLFRRPLLEIWQDDKLWVNERPPNRAGFGIIRC